MATRMLQRRGTAAEWASENQVLAAGEIGVETDTGVIKVGNGVDAWADLTMAWLPVGGGTMAGALNLIAPTADNHAVRKIDLDTAVDSIAERPGGALAYSERTTNESVSAASEFTNLSAAIDAVSSDRLIRITAHLAITAPSGSPTRIIVQVRDNSLTTNLGKIVDHTIRVDGETMLFEGSIVLNPPSGINIYRLYNNSSALTHDASANAPGWFLVEDIGPIPELV